MDFMVQLAAAPTGSTELTRLLVELRDRGIPVPADIEAELLRVYSLNSMISLFLGGGGRDDKDEVLDMLKWFDDDALESDAEPDSDEDMTAPTQTMGPVIAPTFDPLHPRLRDLRLDLNGRLGFLLDTLENHVLPACVNNGKESAASLLAACASLESMAEAHMASLIDRPANLTELLQQVRSILGVVNPLPKPHHFKAFLDALASHQAKEAGRNHNLISSLLLKGGFPREDHPHQ